MTLKEAIKFCEEHKCEECSIEDRRTEYQKKVLQYPCCWNLVDEFDLEHQLNNLNISIDTLISKYGYNVTTSGKTKTVFTAPRTIIFGGEQFIGRFFFKDNIIRHIILEPIIKGVEIPNYPTKEYQDIKYEFCKNILNRIYGNNCYVSSFGVQWDIDKYTISCFKIVEGIDRYTGGNISIDIGSYNERYN